jgi:hypothetical protein
MEEKKKVQRKGVTGRPPSPPKDPFFFFKVIKFLIFNILIFLIKSNTCLDLVSFNILDKI